MRSRHTEPWKYVAPFAEKLLGSMHGSVVVPQRLDAVVAGHTACGSRRISQPMPWLQSASAVQSLVEQYALASPGPLPKHVSAVHSLAAHVAGVHALPSGQRPAVHVCPLQRLAPHAVPSGQAKRVAHSVPSGHGVPMPADFPSEVQMAIAFPVPSSVAGTQA